MKKILETRRLILREMTDEDFDSLKAIISDPETMKYYQKPYDDNGVQRWLDWCKESYKTHNFGLWAVILKETGEMIGNCGVSMQYIDREEKPEIGYQLNKKHHRQGYGKEMTREVRDYFFTRFNFDEVYSYMTIDNVPSIKTAEANGMTYLHDYYARGGELTKVYRITRNEWKNILSKLNYPTEIKYEYKLTTEKDIDKVMEIIEDGRQLLSTQNSGQRQDGYPNRERMLEDINNKCLYFVLDESHNPVGVGALTYHEDDYDCLYEGKRITNYPYTTIHRIAVSRDNLEKGYGKQLIQLFIDISRGKGYKSIRIDTHENNYRLRNLLQSFGFINCGKAILKPNKDRIVYEKLL